MAISSSPGWADFSKEEEVRVRDGDVPSSTDMVFLADVLLALAAFLASPAIARTVDSSRRRENATIEPIC